MMTDNKLLKIALIRNGMSVLELCAKCGFSTGYYYRCLRGEQDFRVTAVAAICKCLNIDTDEMTAIFFSKAVAKTAT